MLNAIKAQKEATADSEEEKADNDDSGESTEN